MRLHDLKPASGSKKDRKRLGRGNASGTGTTAGKGTKGEKARSGGMRAGFRGMSSRNFRLAHRRGFSNARFRTEYQPLNLSRLSGLPAGSTIDVDALKAAGLVSGKSPNVKILADGEMTVALNFRNLKMSAAARQKIEAAGGSVITDDNAAAGTTSAEAETAANARETGSAATVPESSSAPLAPETPVVAPTATESSAGSTQPLAPETPAVTAEATADDASTLSATDAEEA